VLALTSNLLKFVSVAGLLQYWDAVSVHPYRQNNRKLPLIDYIAIRQLIKRYAQKAKIFPLFLGNGGYSSVGINFNETKQGKYLQRELLSNVME